MKHTALLFSIVALLAAIGAASAHPFQFTPSLFSNAPSLVGDAQPLSTPGYGWSGGWFVRPYVGFAGPRIVSPPHQWAWPGTTLQTGAPSLIRMSPSPQPGGPWVPW